MSIVETMLSRIAGAGEALMAEPLVRGRASYGMANDLVELSRYIGCDDLPLQISPGPLRVEVALISIAGFQFGYSSSNRSIVFEQFAGTPTVCLHNDDGVCEIDILDEPRLVARPAERPAICLMLDPAAAHVGHGENAQPLPVPSLPRFCRALRSMMDTVAHQCGHGPVEAEVVLGSADVLTILAMFQHQMTRHVATEENAKVDQTLLKLLDLARVRETRRIDELVDQLNMTPRNLHYYSTKTVGVSPKKLVKSMALRDVMMAMPHAAAVGKSIGDLAFEKGFDNFPRFSFDYRTLFGERPSETMQRYRRA